MGVYGPSAPIKGSFKGSIRAPSKGFRVWGILGASWVVITGVVSP